MNESGELQYERDTQAGELLYILVAHALFSQRVRLYDRTRGGKQSFHEGGTVFLEIERGVERSLGESNLKLSRFIYTNAVGRSATIWADGQGKIYFVDWSSGFPVFVRQGYETLRRP